MRALSRHDFTRAQRMRPSAQPFLPLWGEMKQESMAESNAFVEQGLLLALKSQQRDGLVTEEQDSDEMTLWAGLNSRAALIILISYSAIGFLQLKNVNKSGFSTRVNQEFSPIASVTQRERPFDREPLRTGTVKLKESILNMQQNLIVCMDASYFTMHYAI